MASAMKKVEKIRQIVQLKQVMRRWKDLSLRRLHRPGVVTDYGGGASSPGRPVPPLGSLAVYVGPERRRFVIPTRFLNLPVFTSLLKQAEEEFGFSSAGGLVLPCPVEFFRRVLELLDMDEDRFKGLSLEGFTEIADLESPDLSSCRDEADRYDGFSPLLTKARV